jgi:hypothetical protein
MEIKAEIGANNHSNVHPPIKDNVYPSKSPIILSFSSTEKEKSEYHLD